MPRVTVGLAVRNGADSLASALEAVFSQTYRDFEVLVIDDGSTDDSADIAARFDCRLVRVPNAGLGSARRRIVELAEGELIAFVDHDDFWLPHKLEREIALLDATSAVMVHSNGWYVYPDRVVHRDITFPADAPSFDHILPGNRVIASTAVFRREAMLEAGNFISETVRCSDWYGWFVLAPGRRFAHLAEPLVRYSVLDTSLANAGYRFHAAQYELLTRHIIPREAEIFAELRPEQRSQYHRMLTRNVGIALSSMAKHKRAAGEKREARRLAIHAIRLSPDVGRVWSRAARMLLP